MNSLRFLVISWALTLAGCSLVFDSGDFEVGDASADTRSDSSDGGSDSSRDGGMDSGDAGCVSNAECEALGLGTDLCVDGSCVQCESNMQCEALGGGLGFCMDGTCVECANDGDCSELAPEFTVPSCGDDGMCVTGECVMGRADCDTSAPDCEADLSSPATCGTCSVACVDPTPICDGLVAPPECTDDCDATICDGSCVDTTTSPLHCGDCGVICDVPEGALEATCAESECGFTCVEGLANCDEGMAGCETNTTSDLANCGRCGMACDDAVGATAVCMDSSCGLVCDADQLDCDDEPGCEVDRLSDATNCGGCGVVCAAGALCVDGVCDQYVDVGVSSNHTCALRGTGSLDCWGANESRQVEGDRSMFKVEEPFRVRWDRGAGAGEEDLKASAISVGESMNCFISDHPGEEGELYCWGSNSEFRRGSTAVNNWPPQRVLQVGGVEPIPNVVSVASRSFHSCAIDVDGDLWCWGAGGSSRNGAPPMMTTQVNSLARRITLPSDAVQAVVSIESSCVLLDTGEVHCFGGNSAGELGRGFLDSGFNPDPEPVLAVTGPGRLREVTALAGGFNDFCAITGPEDDNELVCWGRNLNSAITTEVSIVDRPRVVASNVGSVFMPFHGICWTDRDTNEAICRGRRTENQFGSGPVDGAPFITGTRQPQLDGISNIDAGNTMNCGFRDGALFCWGYNAHGELPRDTLVEDSPTPIVDDEGMSISSMTQVSMGSAGACGLIGSNAYCWGFGGISQQGNGTNRSEPVPTLVPDFDNVVQVSRGHRGVCAVHQDGGVNRLSCWGVWRPGSLTNSSRPAVVAGVDDPIAVSLGVEHGCAIERGATEGEGEVVCWGLNNFGQVGEAPAPSPPVPVLPVTAVMQDGSPLVARQLTAGNGFTCAIRGGAATGTVTCWGANASGQLGRGTTSTRELPGDTSITDAARIDAGDGHVCAVLTTDVLQCWGLNRFGQLGDGSRDNSSTPVDVVVDDREPVSVAAGAESTCATYDDGLVRCWGENARRQRGVPGGAVNLPELVEGPVNISEVVNGTNLSYASCGGRMDGTWACWGLNEFGRLGTDPNLVLAPTEVMP